MLSQKIVPVRDISALLANQPFSDVTLEKLSAEACRAGAVVQRIRELAQNHTRDCELVDCNRLMQDVEALAASDARAYGIRLEMELEPDLLPVWRDPIELKQVVRHRARWTAQLFQQSNGWRDLRASAARCCRSM